MDLAIIGSGMIGRIPTDLSCQVIVIDDLKDVSNELKVPIRPLEIEPLLISESYVDFEFKRKKKPKNKDWQNRIKSLTNKNY